MLHNSFLSGVEQYTVKYKLGSAADFMTRRSEEAKFVADGLLPGSNYNFEIYSVGKDSKADTQNPATITVQTGQLTILQARLGHSQTKGTWSPKEGINFLCLHIAGHIIL